VVVQDEESLKKLSEQVRRKWIDHLNSGLADVRTLIEYSKKSDEDKYIAQIRLINILIARPDWSKATALEVLQRHGFNDKSTIRTLRGAPIKTEAFETILKTAADRWRARAEPPKGWPWSGKLSLLIETAGDSIPDELAALMEDDEDDDDIIETDYRDDDVDDDLLSLMNDDDDDEDD
jgi:hypothetical protein